MVPGPGVGPVRQTLAPACLRTLRTVQSRPPPPSTLQGLLDAGGNYYSAWYWAKTQDYNTVCPGTPTARPGCPLNGACGSVGYCVYGQTLPASYGYTTPLTTNSTLNALGQVQYQVDPVYAAAVGANSPQNVTYWGWNVFAGGVFPGIVSVACASPVSCTAVGSASVVASGTPPATYSGTNAFGGQSTLLTTRDGGFSWTQYNFVTAANANPSAFPVNGPPSCDLNKVFFANSFIGFAVGGDAWGNNGCILKTTDGGTTWTEQVPPNIQFSQMYQVVDTTGACVTGSVLGTPALQCWNTTFTGTTGVNLLSGGITGVYVPSYNCDGNVKTNNVTYVMSPFLCYQQGMLNNLAASPPVAYFYPSFPNLMSVGATSNGRYAYAVSAVGNYNLRQDNHAIPNANQPFQYSLASELPNATISFTNVSQVNMTYTYPNGTFQNITLINVTNQYTLPVPPTGPPVQPVIMQYIAAAGWAPLNYSVQYCGVGGSPSSGACFPVTIYSYPSLAETAVDLVDVAVVTRNFVVVVGANFVMFSSNANTGVGAALFTLTYPLGPQADVLLNSAALAASAYIYPGTSYFVDLGVLHLVSLGGASGTANITSSYNLTALNLTSFQANNYTDYGAVATALAASSYNKFGNVSTTLAGYTPPAWNFVYFNNPAQGFIGGSNGTFNWLMQTNNGGLTWGCVQDPKYGHGAGGVGSGFGLGPANGAYTNPGWPAGAAATCVGSAPYNVKGAAYDNSTRLWFYGVDAANWGVGPVGAAAGASAAATIATVTAAPGATLITENTGGVAGGGAYPSLGAWTTSVWSQETNGTAGALGAGTLTTGAGGTVNELYELYGVVSVANIPSKLHYGRRMEEEDDEPAVIIV